MSLSEYEDFVFCAGLLDHPDPVAAWKKISERQQRLVDFLNGKSDYHVVAANGTDVRMSVAGMTWINCDGHENFPDGEVFTGPVIDSVNGADQFQLPRGSSWPRVRRREAHIQRRQSRRRQRQPRARIFSSACSTSTPAAASSANAPSARISASRATRGTPCSTKRSAARCTLRWGGISRNRKHQRIRPALGYGGRSAAGRICGDRRGEGERGREDSRKKNGPLAKAMILARWYNMTQRRYMTDRLKKLSELTPPELR